MDMEERRRYFRLKNGVRVVYKKAARSGERELKVADVSGGGIRLPLDEKVEPGTFLELNLILPDDKSTFFAFAKVVWQKANSYVGEDGNKYFDTGVEFLKMNLKDRLEVIHYVHTRINKDNTK